MVSLCYTILGIGAEKIEEIEVEEVWENGAKEGRRADGRRGSLGEDVLITVVLPKRDRCQLTKITNTAIARRRK